MKAHFAEVLSRESTRLAQVTDGTTLAAWRQHVVDELLTPDSPYVLVLRQTGDAAERSDFLAQWRGLLEEAVGRLLQADATCPVLRAKGNGTDDVPHKTAVLILAALHGGNSLSQLAQDPWPLNAALDIALAPFATAPEDTNGSDPTPRRPTQ
jgi:hypothetical protein